MTKTVLIAVSDKGEVFRSPDEGATWGKTFQDNLARALRDVWSSEGLTIAVGDGGVILASGDDGATWTVAKGVPKERLVSVGGDATGVQVVAESGLVLQSRDGVTWETTAASAPFPGKKATRAAMRKGVLSAVDAEGRISTFKKGQWSEEWTGPRAQLHALSGEVGSGVYVAGSGGTLLYSKDGWAFTAQASGTTQALRGIAALSPRHVVAVGDGGTILVTEDAGKRWRKVDAGLTEDLHDVRALEGKRLIAVGGRGVALLSKDGAKTWERLDTGVTRDLRRVRAITAQQLFAVGEQGTLVMSADGGASWSALALPTKERLEDVWAHEDTLVVVGANDTALHSADRGKTWLSLSLPKVPDGKKKALVTLWSRTPRSLWMAGYNGRLYISANQGRTFKPQLFYPVEDTNALAGGGAVVFALADNQMYGRELPPIVSDEASRWQVLRTETERTLSAVTGLPDGFLLGGDDSNLYELSDVSRKLEPVDTGFRSGATVPRFHALWAGESGRRYAAGTFANSGILLRSDDHGGTWELQRLGLGDKYGLLAPLFDLHAVSNDELFLVGTQGKLIYATEGGAQGKGLESHLKDKFGAIAAVDARTLIAVGELGAIRRSGDGGVTWEVVPADTTANLLGVWTDGAKTVWAVGSDGAMLQSLDGGLTWKVRAPQTTERLWGIWGDGAGNLYAVGEAATLLRSKDAGKSWTRELVSVGVDLLGIGGKRNGPVCVVGDDGYVLRLPGPDETKEAPTAQAWRPANFRKAPALPAGSLPTHWRATAIPTGLSSPLNAIWARGDVVVAVGNEGWVVRSEDGAKTVERVPLGVITDLASIWGDGEVLIAVGSHGVVVRSDDLGKTWSQRASGVTSELKAIARIGAELWAAGFDGTVLRSSDGGATWTQETTHSDAALFAIGGPSKERVFAVGAEGTILVRTERGWLKAKSGVSGLLETFRYSDGVAYAAGPSIIQSSDGGATWEPASVSVSGVTSIIERAPGELTFFSHSGWHAHLGPGGGAEAAKGRAVSGAPVGCGHFDGATTGWGVTYSGQIAKLEVSATPTAAPASASADDSKPQAPLKWRPVPGAPKQINGIAASDRGLIAVGKGAIYTSAHGTSWQSVRSPASEQLYQVAARGPVAVITGTQSLVLTSQDGGQTWTAQRFSVDFGVGAPVALSPSEWFMPAKKGVLLLSVDSGRKWKKKQLDTDQNISAVATTSDGRVLVSDSRRRLFVSKDRGVTWATSTALETHGPSVSKMAVRGDEIVIAGTQRLVRSPDGGETWEVLQTPTAKPIYGLHLAPERLVLAASNGEVFSTSDRGATWTAARAPDGLTDVTMSATGGLFGLARFGLVTEAR